MSSPSAFITPPPLSPGDRVAIVAPSSGAAARARHILALGCERLSGHFDVDPIVHPTARQADTFLREHPRARAAAIHASFRNPDIAGVFATIGGDDQLRILKHLDPAVLRANPTRFFGMSDNTNLALYLWTQGIVSYYGGQLMNQIATPGPMPAFSKRYLRRALFEDHLGELEEADAWADMTVGWDDPAYPSADPGYEPNPGWTWTGGTDPVTGRLWGGCLAILEWQLMAGRYLPEAERLDGTILLLETAEDRPRAERVKWALMSMGERGLLERFGAVLVGRPATRTWRESPTPEERLQYRRDQRRAIRSQLQRYNPDAPVVFDLDVGHTNPTMPLPIGARVHVDPEAERLVCE